MIKIKNTLIETIVTCFFIGKIKFAPGTFGSLLAFPLTYYIVGATMRAQPLTAPAFQVALKIMVIVIVALFILGWFCSAVYVKNRVYDDPREVVIDEVVGQMIVITFGSAAAGLAQNSSLYNIINPNTMDFVFLFLMPFILFRIFDIFKPWPIGWLDKNIHGGLGIMLDDVLAGVFAVVMQYFLTLIVIDWLAPAII